MAKMTWKDWEALLDKNMDKKIKSCFINDKGRYRKEIFVIYQDGCREAIHSFNPNKYDFTIDEFIGKTKLEAVFYCDRKMPMSSDGYYGRSWAGR